METSYLFHLDLTQHPPLPESGILSRTLYNDDHVRVVHFTFSAGKELTAHAVPMAATILVLSGEGEFRMGEDRIEAQPGSFFLMAAQLEHAVRAQTELVFVLTMVKDGRPASRAGMAA